MGFFSYSGREHKLEFTLCRLPGDQGGFTVLIEDEVFGAVREFTEAYKALRPASHPHRWILYGKEGKPVTGSETLDGVLGWLDLVIDAKNGNEVADRLLHLGIPHVTTGSATPRSRVEDS